MKTCPQCGQTLPGPLPEIRLAGYKRQILEYVHKAGKHGIRTDVLCDRLYAHLPNGGPDQAIRSMYVCIWNLNQLLKPHGLRIVGEQVGGSRDYGMYRLVESPTKK